MALTDSSRGSFLSIDCPRIFEAGCSLNLGQKVLLGILHFVISEVAPYSRCIPKFKSVACLARSRHCNSPGVQVVFHPFL